MRWSEARGTKVVAMDTASAAGVLDGFLIDAARAQVVALRLRKTHLRATLLPWGDVHGFGDDAITVAGVDRIVEADADLGALTGKSAAVLGKRVLSTAGVDLGKATDVDIDTATGAVTALILPDQQISGARLLGAGPYAVVVRA